MCTAGGPGGGTAGTGGSAGGAAGTGVNVDAAIDQPISADAADGASGDAPADGTEDAGTCTPTERPPLREFPDILILLDASGSMNNDLNDLSCTTGCGADSKWAQMVPAINQIVAATDSSVNWGLKFFADTDSSCGVGSGLAVPIAPGNAAAIATAIAGRTTANGGLANGSRTPTRVVESVAANVLSTSTDTNRKFILLATDGLPNCAPGNADMAADDSAGAVAAVSDAASRGFATFVVGIATGSIPVADQTLSAMAVAGGRARNGTPAYYPVSSTSELLAALNGIVGQAGVCTVAIGAPPPGATLDAIDVHGDGTPIARDPTHTSGWDYADAAHTSIALFGTACTAVQSGAIQSITIVFRCPPSG
jgi:hypothetical protein